MFKQAFLSEVFQFLFALPSPTKRYFPKCKSHASRSGAYDLLVELVKGNIDNYNLLHQKMLLQHTKGRKLKKQNFDSLCIDQCLFSFCNSDGKNASKFV